MKHFLVEAFEKLKIYYTPKEILKFIKKNGNTKST